jgi:hypothetical protein
MSGMEEHLATVREALMKYARAQTADFDREGSYEKALAALSAIASELERLAKQSAAREVLATKGNEWRKRAEAAEAELERVRAERDAQAYRAEQHVQKWVESDAGKLQARLDRAESVLTKIAAMKYEADPQAPKIARAALADIEWPDGDEVGQPTC